MIKYLLIILVFTSQFSKGQTIYFEKAWGSFGGVIEEYAYDVIQNEDSSYYVLASQSWLATTRIQKIDKFGNLISDNAVAQGLFFNTLYFDKTIGNNFMICSAPVSSYHFGKCDSIGNLLADTILDAINSQINKYENNYLFLSTVSATTFDTIKISVVDTNLSIQKVLDILPDSIHTYTPAFIKYSLDNTFIIVSGFDIRQFNRGLSVMKIDTSGTIIWKNDFPDTLNPFSMQSISYDTSVIVSGATFDSTYTIPSRLFNIKFDKHGNVVWYKISSRRYNYLSIIETKDHGFAIGANEYNGPGSLSDIVLIKHDSLGTELWAQYFDYCLNWDYFGSVKETFDKGFIISGMTYCPGEENDYYLVKTDSMGNSGPFTSADEIINSKPLFSIFPNPTENNFTIKINSEVTNVHIDIYDLLGTKLYSAVLQNNEEIINNTYPSGIYFVKAVKGENQFVKKLIVQ